MAYPISLEPVIVSEPPPRSSCKQIFWLCTWVLAGLVEGFVIAKTLVSYPKVLADQFVFRNFIVLKMFMSAVGSSMLAQSMMATCMPERFGKSRIRGTKVYGYGRAAFGCGILGVGMAIAGNGPTMIAPAIGSGVSTAGYLVVGSCIAAAVVGIMDKSKLPMSAQGEPGVRTLDALVGADYLPTAALAGTALVIVTIALEYFVNFKTDASKYGGALAEEYPSSFLSWPAWPPSLAGIAIGIGQVPVRFVSGNGMGGSTSYTVIISTLTGGWISPKLSLFKSLSNGWQTTYNYVWVLLGALLAYVSNSLLPVEIASESVTHGFAPLRMVAGSFLAILGSRIAGGCTCGHGVTGTSELSLESFVGAGAIFAAAIGTRCIMVFALDVNL